MKEKACVHPKVLPQHYNIRIHSGSADAAISNVDGEEWNR